MDPVLLSVLVVVLVVGAIALALFFPIRAALRASRNRKAIEAFGWHTEPPAWDRIAQFTQPPFNYGFGRTVSQAIIGTTSDGTPFQAFEYGHTMPNYSQRVAMIALPQALPPVFVSTDTRGHSRIAADGTKIEFGPRWDAVLDIGATDPGFARALFTPQLLDLLLEWASLPDESAGFDLGIDGANLVALRAPSTDEPERLRWFVDQMARVARALDHDRLRSYAITPPPPKLGFRHTDWTWQASNAALVQEYAGTGPVGRGERPVAQDVVTGTHRGVEFTAFNYRWEHTYTSTNSIGDTAYTTTRVEVHHQSVIAVHLPTRMPTLTIALGKQPYALRIGPVQKTSFPAFDKSFDVWTSHPEFARDVLTESMVGWLLQWRPGLLLLNGNRLIAFATAHSPQQIWATLDFLSAFCDLIPEPVWTRVGAQRPALSERVAEPAGLVGADAPAPSAPPTDLR